MRLKRASYRLVFNRLERIIDIALDAGSKTRSRFPARSKRFRTNAFRISQKSGLEAVERALQISHQRKEAEYGSQNR